MLARRCWRRLASQTEQHGSCPPLSLSFSRSLGEPHKSAAGGRQQPHRFRFTISNSPLHLVVYAIAVKAQQQRPPFDAPFPSPFLLLAKSNKCWRFSLQQRKASNAANLQNHCKLIDFHYVQRVFHFPLSEIANSSSGRRREPRLRLRSSEWKMIDLPPRSDLQSRHLTATTRSIARLRVLAENSAHFSHAIWSALEMCAVVWNLSRHPLFGFEFDWFLLDNFIKRNLIKFSF